MLKKEELIFCPVVNYKMNTKNKIKHIIKHFLINKNLNYNNVKNAKKMFSEKNYLFKELLIPYLLIMIYILKNA